MERYLLIGKTNLKYNLLPHLLVAIVFLSISPLLMGVENLNPVNTAKVLEMYVALLGIILITPIFYPEQNKDIMELVQAKYTPATVVVLIRIFEAIFSLVIMIWVYILVLRYNQCIFPVTKYFFGTISEAIFLGGMGLCGYSIFNQVAVAYMLPMVYYILAMGGGKALQKELYLFGMGYGDYNNKLNLLVAGIVLLIIALCYPYIKRCSPGLLRWAIRRSK